MTKPIPVLSLAALRAANLARRDEWTPGQHPDLSFRGVELGGEVGEAQNIIKKLERERLGWRGSRSSVAALAEELADVVICTDLCALTAGVDLDAAVVAKFNATSEKIGLATRLSAELSDAVGLKLGLERLAASCRKLLAAPVYENKDVRMGCSLVFVAAILEIGDALKALGLRQAIAEGGDAT